MFQYQGTATLRPLRVSKSSVGGSQPDLRPSPSGKLSVGSARMGTSMKRSTAPSAMPSLGRSPAARGRSSAPRPGPPGRALASRGQLVYQAAVRHRALLVEEVDALGAAAGLQLAVELVARLQEEALEALQLQLQLGAAVAAVGLLMRTWPRATARSSACS
jgi:hypothetical protein